MRGSQTTGFSIPIILAMVLSVMGSRTAQAADFVVNSFIDARDVDPGDGKCATNGTLLSPAKCTLRAAIMEANHTAGGPHNIFLPPGTYTVSNLPNPDNPGETNEEILDLNVFKSMNFTVTGGTAVIQGASGFPSRIFDLAAPGTTTITVTMTNLDIANGHAGDGNPGGAIRISSGVTVSLNNVTVRGSRVDGQKGGGISNHGSLTLNNCTIKDNTASGDGGGISNDGGTLVVLSSSITGNNATDGAGISNTGNLSVSRSNLDQNIASFAGGAVYNQDNIASLVNVSMSSNQAKFGGGVANRTSGVTSMFTVDRTTFDGNIAFGSGGAILNESVVILKNTTLNGNVSFGAPGGGAIHNLRTGSDAQLYNSTVSGNGAFNGGVGGGVFAEAGVVRLANTILSGNTAVAGPDCGGAALLLALGFDLIQSISGCSITGVNAGSPSPGNIVGQDPLLGPLQANGGVTLGAANVAVAKTRALGTGSPAIDHGSPGQGPVCLDIDERQVPRPQDGDKDSKAVCDIGAFEAGPVGNFELTPGDSTVEAGDVLQLTLKWSTPEHSNWRDLKTLQLQLVSGGRLGFDLLWNQLANTFQVLDTNTNGNRPDGLPGEHAVLEGRVARLLLEGTTVKGSGPAGHDVTLTLPIVLKEPAAGRNPETYDIQVAATDDSGNSQPFAIAGTVTVVRRNR